MLQAVIDPALVASHEAQTDFDFLQFVDTVMQLRNEVRSNLVAFLPNPGVFELLAEADLFPLRESYSAVVDRLSLREFVGGMDVARLVLDLLEHLARTDDALGACEVEVIDGDFVDSLRGLCDCHPSIDAAARAAVISAAASTAVRPESRPVFFASLRRLPTTLGCRCRFSLLLDAKGEEVQPKDVELNLPLARSLHDSLLVLDPEELLARSENDRELSVVAIAAEVQRKSGGACLDWDLHPEFVERLTSTQVLHAAGLTGKLIRALGEIVTGAMLRDTHALRDSASGGAAQRTNGNAKAWRQDVDSEWHIHYWQFPEGRVQIAHLGVHNDFSIAAPVAREFALAPGALAGASR